MDDPQPIDLTEWSNKPKAGKRRSTNPPPPPEGETADIERIRTAAESKKLDSKTVEEIAELAVRRAANQYLLGGDTMLSKTPKEASEIAKTWAQVAALDKARRVGDSTEAEDAMRKAREDLKALRSRIKNAGGDQ